MYDPQEIEPRWQKRWRDANVFSVPEFDPGRPDSYVGTSFPFTTGDAHLGHVRNLTITDAYARFLRAQGHAVLHSIGFDAFGLPNELIAIQNHENPKTWVRKCQERMAAQFDRLGYSFDWSRTYLSSDEDLYRWSQWLFLKFLENDLIYRSGGEVDWCDRCGTVLASMQVIDGRCWRCDAEVRVVQRTQWYFRYTAYLGELERGLPGLTGWSDVSHEVQRTLIGKSDGVEVDLPLAEGHWLPVFTPHRDSLNDAEFVMVSPHHPELARWIADAGTDQAIEACRKTVRSRADRSVDAVPIANTGIMVELPGAGRQLPVVVCPLVDDRAGGAAVFGIPRMDKVDAIIAKRLGIPVGEPRPPAEIPARSAVRFRGKDVAISRQRFWSAPIPIIYCSACGIVPVPESDLPVRLPDDVVPTGEGNPLEKHPTFTSCNCPRCGVPARREHDTIDGLIDALWYLIPLCVPAADRSRAMFDHPELRRWMPAAFLAVGSDVGGYTMGLRLFSKAIRDCGFMRFLPDAEPIRTLVMHELVLRERRKMSKHLGNVVNPNDLVREFGADALRLAILYAAGPKKAIEWESRHILHCHRFLTQLWEFIAERLDELRQDGLEAPHDEAGDPLRRRLQVWRDTAAAKVTQDLETHASHLAVADVMFLFDRIRQFEQWVVKRRGTLDSEDRKARAVATGVLLRLLAPLAPHAAEELWEACGGGSMLATTRWLERSAATPAPPRAVRTPRLAVSQSHLEGSWG